MKQTKPLPKSGEELNNVDQQVLVDALAKALLDAAGEQQKQQVLDEDKNTRTIDLVELFYVILSKIHLVLILALAGAIFFGVRAANVKPVYSATSKLYIAGSQGAALNISDLQLGDMLTQDYEEVFKTWEVHEMVASQLGLDYNYSQMQSMISLYNPENTRVLYITAKSSNAHLAADMANAYAEAACTFILQTMDSEEPNIFSYALVPTVPMRVSKASEVAKGFLLGAMLALALITVMFVIDDRPRTPKHIQQAAGIPTLAVIPAMAKEHHKNGKRGGKRALS